MLGVLLLMGAVATATVARAQTADQTADSKFSTLYAMSQGGEVASALRRPVSIDLKRAPLVDALREIARQANFGLAYSPDLVVGHQQLVSVRIDRGSAAEALRAILENTDLRVLITPNNEIVLVKASAIEAMQALPPDAYTGSTPERNRKIPAKDRLMTGTITGTITDSTTGEPIPGVNVMIAGTQQGAATDAGGTYTISGVEPGTYTLRASFIGYNTKTIEGVEVTDEETTVVDFVLQREALGLDQVVVTGYGGQQNRSEVTGAISSISGDDIESAPSTGLGGILQGRVPGVTVSPNSGKPGAPIDVNVRGVGSFGNANPLYVIDGVPVSNDIISTGVGQSNPLALINPSNIESIEILKDASATAIYGARGANGVVLITTKKGIPGMGMRVSYEARFGISQNANSLEMANSKQYAKMANAADDAAGNPRQPALNNPEVLATSTGWADEAFRPAPVMSHNLSVSGGTEDLQYFVSGGYLNEKGTLINNGFKRYNARINTSFDLGSWIRIGESLTLSHGEWWGGYSPGTDQLHELLQSAPTLPVHCEQNLGGFCGPTPEVTGRNNRSNRIAIWSLRDDEQVQNRILGNAFAEVDLTSGLTLRLDAGIDYLNVNSTVFMPSYEAGNRSNPTADLSENRRMSRMHLLEGTLSYNKTFADDHSVSAVAGYTQQSTTIENLNASIQEFPSNTLRILDVGTGSSSMGGSVTSWALTSFLARVNYAYADKYLLTGTFRRDGSSRFGPSNRWGNFPSFSLGWVVSEEPFMDEVSVIDHLKIRGSWGKTGSQNIANYASFTAIQNYSRYILGEAQSVVPGAAVLSYGNPNLKWETSVQTNIGLDLRLFDSRLSVIADYYVENISDVLLQLPIATTAGVPRAAGPVRNAAGIRNSGFEFGVTYYGSAGALQYSLNGNMATVHNEVTTLGEGLPIIAREAADPAFVLTYTAAGGPIGAFYGYVMDGLFQTPEEVEAHALQPGAAPGDIRFKDLNGDGIINAQDRTVIGSPIPDFTFGLNGNFSYRNVDLAVFFDGSYGNEIYNLLRPGLSELQGDNNVLLEVYKNYWRGAGTSNFVPRPVAGDPNDNDRPSTRFLEDGSYLRLRNIQVGYTFSNLSGIGLETEGQVRVYLGAHNLFTLTGYSGYTPDVGSVLGGTLIRGVDLGMYPVARQFYAGIQLTGL